MFAGLKIYLRPTTLDDAQKSTQWFNSSELREFLGMQKTPTVEERRLFLQNKLNDPNEINFAIILKKENIYIGNIYLYHLDTKNKEAEIGLFIGEEKYHCQGYASEALSLIEDYAFKKLKLKRLYLKTLNYNKKAYNCFLKNNYTLKLQTNSLMILEKYSNYLST